MTQATVLGTGAWGTALAVHIARLGTPVRLWGRDSDRIESLAARRCNDRYLPDVILPDNITLHKDIKSACFESSLILCVIPSIGLRDVFEQLKATINVEDRCIAWACKGLEQSTGYFPHQIAAEVLGTNVPSATIGGPSFASEVAAGKPTAIVVATSHGHTEPVDCLHGQSMRVYPSKDVMGLEIAGVFKNVIASAAGISDALGLGDNARAAIITRGSAEMVRLITALGGEPKTGLGLAGLGDLILSCSSAQSRNYRYGHCLGSGMSTQDALQTIDSTVESHHTAPIIVELAKKHRLDLPICDQVNQVVHHDVSPQQAIAELLRRPITEEQL